MEGKKDNDTGRSLRHASTHPFEEIPPSSILNIFKNQFRVRLFTLAFTHRLKWNRGSISRAHVLNYVEHIRGELTPSSTMSIPRGSMSFHEMNDNSYCLSRPFTRLVKKKKYHFARSKILKYTFFHSILDTVSSSATPQPVHLNVKNGKRRGNRASRTNSNTGGGGWCTRVRLCEADIHASGADQ